jgi:hypothetical protein
MKVRLGKVSTLSIATASLAALALGFSAPTVGAVSAPNLRAEHVPTWWYQTQALPEVRVDLAAVKALMDVKVDLRIQVRVADELFVSSEGKASVETRRALAVERNRAYTAVLFADEPDEVSAVAEQFAPAVVAVTEEVTAWEVAEAARKAEEERLAREEAERAAAAAAKSGRSSKGGSGGGSGGSGQTPQQYLDGVAAAYGTSISWAASACGHSGSWVSGCYTGGSTITVTTNAYSSWDRAKGEGRNVVIHEAAHFKTRYQCGTVYVGGDRFENVTDAFAILLGAGGTTGYGYNSADMDLAKALKAGRCEL